MATVDTENVTQSWWIKNVLALKLNIDMKKKYIHLFKSKTTIPSVSYLWISVLYWTPVLQIPMRCFVANNITFRIPLAFRAVILYWDPIYHWHVQSIHNTLVQFCSSPTVRFQTWRKKHDLQTVSRNIALVTWNFKPGSEGQSPPRW